MDPFTAPLVTVVGLVLVHFLWQGAAIGALTAAVLKAMPRASARTRYGVAGVGLVAMMCAPLVTLGVVWQAAPAAITTTATVAATASIETAVATSASPAMFTTLLPAVVLAWAAGVLLLTARLVATWWRTERVRRHDVRPVGDGLTRALHRLAATLGVRRRVTLLESAWVDVPTVVGWLRPTILLPVGAFMGLSVPQVEAVLSHELAHIKRHDYLINVIQNLAETVLFFHPAVWWISNQLRIEREHCCDDVAVEACGNAVAYARALATLEEARVRQATFALAATDGSLTTRVRRLLGVPSASRADRRRPVWPIAVAVAGLLAVATLSGEQEGLQTLQEEPTATQLSPGRIVLQAGSTMSIPDGDLGTVRVEGHGKLSTPRASSSQRTASAPTDIRSSIGTMRAAIDKYYDDKGTYPMSLGVLVSEGYLRSADGQTFERVNATTIRIDGATYTRGTADDLARLVERVATPRASQNQAAPPVVEATQVVPPATPRAPVRVGGGIREPRKILDVRPVYPEAARLAGISGVVILEAVIDQEGMPVNLRVLRSIPDLDQAAINAVRQWRYTPTLLNGVPVAVVMTTTVNFTLQQPQNSWAALEARYAILQRQAQELARTPEEVAALRQKLLQELAELERELATARAREMVVARAAATSGGPSTPAGSPSSGGAVVIRAGGGIPEPKKTREVRPVYPADAQAAKVAGVVIMEVTIDADGNVTNPRILRGIPMLNQAALDAVSQWKYTTTLVDGVATPVIMTVTINFQLN
jgi:TonB family protein